MEQQLSTLNKLAKAIDFLIDKSYFFAVYSQENSSDFTLIVEQKKQTKNYFKISTFEGENTKVIADYSFTHENIKEVFMLNFKVTNTISQSTLETSTSQENYMAYVTQTIKACKEKQLTKSVAAKRKLVDLKADFSVGQYYVKLLFKYPNTLTHLSHSKFGLWTGATPEILLKYKDNTYHTVALAGTRKANTQEPWGAKEIEEQQIVTDYIVQSLKDIGISDVKITKPYTQNAGQIEHIKTDIYFSSNLAQDKILAKLNPTPAVCGMPKDKARALITKHESKREAYTGYIAFKNSSNELNAYVNLRCMKIQKQQALLYLGAGITAESNALAEWQETENKATTLLSLLK